jgi:hypothetical protein
VSGGLDTVGLRAPNHPVALALIRAANGPLAAPSANAHTHVSPTTAAHVVRPLGDRVDLVMDAGPCSHGIESTVLALSDPPRVLRPGAISLDRLRALAPVVIEPLFADFTKAPQGALRTEVEALAKKSGVHAGEVYTVDAANRTTGANAYVTGLGSTKRVVIYDTLLKDFPPDAVRGVVAHELGHVHHHDVPHGLLYLLIVAPFGMLAVARLAERMAPTRLLQWRDETWRIRRRRSQARRVRRRARVRRGSCARRGSSPR